MDLPAQPELNSSLRLRTFLYPLLTLFLGLVLGLGTNLFFFLKQQQPLPQLPAPSQITAEANLPIGLALLKNPIINQWRGGVEGVLVAKDEDSFTIKDDKGNSIKIPIRISFDFRPGMTIFYDFTAAKKPGETTAVPLKDIPLNSRLRGDFFVLPQDKNEIVGGTFEIIEKGAP